MPQEYASGKTGGRKWLVFVSHADKDTRVAQRIAEEEEA